MLDAGQVPTLTFDYRTLALAVAMILVKVHPTVMQWLYIVCLDWAGFDRHGPVVKYLQVTDEDDFAAAGRLSTRKGKRMSGMRFVLTAVFTIGAASLGWSQANAQDADAAKAILDAWLASPHADADSESFIHWNSEGEIPGACATCHSGIGFRDFVGADGSAAGIIDHPVPIGTTVDCETCHNDAVQALSSVTFPSGVTVSGIEEGVVCMICHQGRASTASVKESVEGAPDDDVDPEIRFVNVHYRAAAATSLGTEVKGGYEYPDKQYMGKFTHVPEFSSCTDCHDPHTLEVAVEPCGECHKTNDPRAIRTSTADFDGNGDVAEGIAAEIDRFREVLGEAIRTYSVDVVGTPVVYADAYPYFFKDEKGGAASEGPREQRRQRYESWTPRMLKAAYNYQFVSKDPGAYAHNPHYALQMLYDSIESLSEQTEIDMTGLTRP